MRTKPKLTFYEKGPGPAAYALPPLVGRKQHAVTHRINPEYTFRQKLQSAFETKIGMPGPADYSITEGMKAKGKFNGYSYTMRRKFDKKKNADEIPGPGQYDVKDVSKPKAPAFKFGLRCPLLNKGTVPAPNAYTLPRTIGPRIPDKIAAAECTLKGTRKPMIPDSSQVPYYTLDRPKKAPGITFGIKWPQKLDVLQASPASYDVKDPACICKTAGGPHLGIRYNEFTGVFRTPCDKLKIDSLELG